ncbi:uncharacterized protein BT62DRAFT_263026 [Guyanagaster necrorhizus]|uniref:Uncharacterized protein n=1 Tax=Guyanagaster necrorhizus TaxID=856835 RepID=A0A9P7W314_9AGAR|nr:uncharacterized protein BT62DRAFT_263026 [Guyanagaster necrorhizus MCA 3950]KAG7451727.1 hypothetical protein BT62DRAFT_263026 [Guyanagaster necrorhizus MCA 3950]
MVALVAILRTNRFRRRIGAQICLLMSFSLRARNTKQQEKWKPKGGMEGFSPTLIGTFRTGNLSEESTYVDLLFLLPRRRGQTPVVAGKHKRERLWYKD